MFLQFWLRCWFGQFWGDSVDPGGWDSALSLFHVQNRGIATKVAGVGRTFCLTSSYAIMKNEKKGAGKPQIGKLKKCASSGPSLACTLLRGFFLQSQWSYGCRKNLRIPVIPFFCMWGAWGGGLKNQPATHPPSALKAFP